MVEQIKIGNRIFPIGNHTYIMGILNVTPDSFSDGGHYNHVDAALKRVETMILEGADMIDIGGESTRPGHTVISDAEEIERVVPMVEAIKERFDIPISVDTYKAPVAKAALSAGGDLINDIWGFKHDPSMANVVKEADAACCLMHNREIGQYGDFIKDCMADLQECIYIAKAAGIEDEKIILDPGVGFAKSLEENLQIIKHMTGFNDLGYPVLLGTSRKSCIGLTLDVPVDERTIGTVATTVLAVMAHMAFVRVHDIKENAQAILMTERILYT